jgi:hypothetical protein
MPKFEITFAADVRAYSVIEIEAVDLTEADAKAHDMAATWPTNCPDDMVFNPEYDTLGNLECLTVDPVYPPK